MNEKNDKIIENEVLEGQITVDEALNLEKTAEPAKEELTSEKEEKKTKGLKLTAGTIAELDVLQGKFSSAEDLVKTLISTYRIQKIEENGYENRAKELNQFNYLIDSLKILYTNSLEIERSTSDRVKIQYKDKIDTLTKSVAVLTSDKIKKEEELKAAVDECKELGSEKDELISQLDAVQKILNDKEKELIQCREQSNMLSDLVSEYKGFKELNINLESQINDLKVSFDEKEKEVTKLSNDLLLAAKDIDNLKSTVSLLNAAAADNKSIIAELKKENKASMEKQEALKDEVNSKNLELTEYKYKVKELTSECAFLKAELNKESDKIMSLSKIVDEKDTKIESILAELDKVKSELNIYELKYIDKLHEKDERIQELEAEFTSLKVKKSKNKKQIE